MPDTAIDIPGKILVVDDEENILRSLKRLLMSENFEVITSSSGEEALNVLKNDGSIGLIISDQRMPGMTGVQFLEKARELSPDTVRMVLTGYADINAAIDAINRGGAFRYITKPWKDDELLSLVREGLQRFALVYENKRLHEIVKQQNEELRKWNSQLEYYVQQQTIEIQKKNEKLEALNRRLKDNFRNSINAFSSLIELRDSSMLNHSRNVANVAVKVARAMKLDAGDVENIAVASLLHDIGKIGIPDVLLQKKEEDMTEEELETYMKHAVRGQAAIDSIEDLRDAGILIRHHHEWFNGKGHPDGLKGTDIPPGARIIAMADFADRRIKNHSGDNAIETVLKELKQELATKFDPDLYPYIEKSVREVYARQMPRTSVVELELKPEDLSEGMVISRDVLSGTGLLILSKGTRLDRRKIEALKRYYKLDPSRTGIFVWVKR